jgi:lipopolysaccharide/colanic/teichoic acid biosynthesis glycosyltransferase
MHCALLLIVDLGLVAISTLAAFPLLPEAGVASQSAVLFHLAATLAVSLPVLLAFGMHRAVWRFASLDDAMRIGIAVTVIVAAASFIGWDAGWLRGTPHALPVMQAFLMSFALLGARIMMRIRHARRRQARHPQTRATPQREAILVVGLNALTDLFLSWSRENASESVDVIGILASGERHRGRLLRACKVLGPPEAVGAVLHDLRVHGVAVDRIILTIPLAKLSPQARAAIAHIEQAGKIRVERLMPQFALVAPSAEPRAADAGDPAPVAEERSTGPSPGFLRAKRAIDVTLAVLFLLIFAPVMLAVFVAVRLDVGAPAIFWQSRPGTGGRPIKVLKFRTMGPARAPDGRSLPDSERVSRLGYLLRRLRLDELPQLVNVLVGQMSFVGPRPLLPIDQPAQPSTRLQLRPGLTGWAQIKGGRHLSIEDKAALDEWYIENACLRLDVVILLLTARTVLFGERIDPHAVQAATRGSTPKTSPAC